MMKEGQLLEWAQVFGNWYGTPAEPVESALMAGQSVVMEIDVQGGIQVAAKCPDAVGILIVPPSDEELERRLAGRGTETADIVGRRLAKAKQELDMARGSGAYKYEVINDELDAAVDRVVAIVHKESGQHD